MVFRHFEITDIKILKKYRYKDKSELEILAMINDWNKDGCSGRYFEMFTVINRGQPVAEISVYEHTPDTAGIAPYTFEPYRRKGFASFAVDNALVTAKKKGYLNAIALVDAENIAALKLFESKKFVSSGEFINTKGIKIRSMKRCL